MLSEIAFSLFWLIQMENFPSTRTKGILKIMKEDSYYTQNIYSCNNIKKYTYFCLIYALSFILIWK